MHRPLLILLLLLSSALSAAAEEFALKDGTKIVGHMIAIKGDRIEVETPYGKMLLKRSDILAIGFPENEIDTMTFHRGAGCEECRQLGYQGRMGIYEILILNEALRPLILSRAPSSTIAQKAIENGMRTLRVDGWNKVRHGLSTIEEVLRVTQTEEHLMALVDDARIETSVRS